MSKKVLDENAIRNELKGSSLYFQRSGDSPAPQNPPKDTAKALVAGPASPQPFKGDETTTPVVPKANTERVAENQKAVVPPESDSPNQVQPTNDGTNEPTKLATTVRSNERKKIRHTFDILADQLLALREIAIEREKMFGERTLLGDLVQEALDMFITKQRNNETTKQRISERSNE